MYKARKYRIYPTSSQKELIHKHCGSVRFLYNLALETKTMAYLGSKVNLSRYDLQKQLVDLKKELHWLKEINSQSLQVALLDLDTAYSNFFKGRADFPKFKKKSNRGSFNVPQNIIVENDLLIIPKFKEGIKMSLHRPIKGTIKSATISVTPTGKYFVSILCDTKEKTPTKAPCTAFSPLWWFELKYPISPPIAATIKIIKSQIIFFCLIFLLIWFFGIHPVFLSGFWLHVCFLEIISSKDFSVCFLKICEYELFVVFYNISTNK